MDYTDKQIRQMVFDWLVEKNSENERNPRENENYKGLAESCYYSVIKDYTPDCPGWWGNILTVAFGNIRAVYVFKMKNKKLHLLLKGERLSNIAERINLDFVQIGKMS